MLTNPGLSDSPASAWQAGAAAWVVPSRGNVQQDGTTFYFLWFQCSLMLVFVAKPWPRRVAWHSDNNHNALSAR